MMFVVRRGTFEALPDRRRRARGPAPVTPPTAPAPAARAETRHGRQDLGVACERVPTSFVQNYTVRGSAGQVGELDAEQPPGPAQAPARGI